MKLKLINILLRLFCYVKYSKIKKRKRKRKSHVVYKLIAVLCKEWDI